MPPFRPLPTSAASLPGTPKVARGRGPLLRSANAAPLLQYGEKIPFSRTKYRSKRIAAESPTQQGESTSPPNPRPTTTPAAAITIIRLKLGVKQAASHSSRRDKVLPVTVPRHAPPHPPSPVPPGTSAKAGEPRDAGPPPCPATRAHNVCGNNNYKRLRHATIKHTQHTCRACASRQAGAGGDANLYISLLVRDHRCPAS